MIGEDFHQRFSWNEKEHFSEMKLSTNLFDDTRLCSSLRETHMIGGHVQKESIMCGIIIFPAPIIDSFLAWNPYAIKTQRKAKPLVGDFGWHYLDNLEQ